MLVLDVADLSSFFVFVCFFFSSRRRHTRCALVTGVQTCALPIFRSPFSPPAARWRARGRAQPAAPRARAARPAAGPSWLRPHAAQHQTLEAAHGDRKSVV